MSLARANFISRLKSLEKAIDVDAVKDKALTETAHNDIARILRNGLAVVGFAALEDFIKSRCSEILSEIGNTGIRFSSLPEKLRHAVTFEAVSSLSYQMTLRDKTDRTNYIQDHASKIASTSNTRFDLTPHALGYDQANVSDETIKKILTCFNIENAWQQISTISSRIGLTALPLDESYRNAARRRHRAAHVAHANTPQLDITQYIKEALGIAISYDFLLSQALNNTKAHNAHYLNGTNKISERDIRIRTIKLHNGRWKELTETGRKAVKANSDIELVRASALANSNRHKDGLIIYQADGLIAEWTYPT